MTTGRSWTCSWSGWITFIWPHTEHNERAVMPCVAAACGKFVLVRQLLETYSYDTNSHGRITGPSCQLCPTVLCLTVDRGHEEESVELLLAHGADTISVAFLDLQFTQYYLLLLAAGADPYYASALLNTLLLQLAIRGGPAVFQVPL